MSLPDDSEMSMMEKFTIMRLIIDQRDWLILALLARCGGDAKVTKEELDFVRKTYDVDESVKSTAQNLTDVHLKLKLKV